MGQDRNSMNRFFAFVTILMLGVPVTSLRAENAPVVVELYTSQGCSACPPADALLARLGDYEDIIPLALHVDYWDYIGWKDKFAMPAFTKRQKAYAHSLGTNIIYTPQMVINGSDSVVGTRTMDVSDLVQAHKAKGLPAKLDIDRADGILTIKSRPNSHITAAAAGADVIVVRYRPSATVDVARGENAGKTLAHSFIVTEWTDVGDWDGASELSQAVPVEGPRPIVVLVQEKGHGAIFAAARLR